MNFETEDFPVQSPKSAKRKRLSSNSTPVAVFHRSKIDLIVQVFAYTILLIPVIIGWNGGSAGLAIAIQNQGFPALASHFYSIVQSMGQFGSYIGYFLSSLVVLLLINRILLQWTTHLSVYENYLVYETGIVIKKNEMSKAEAVLSVDYQQNLVDRIANQGTIVITAFSRTGILIPAIASPRMVQKCIMDMAKR